MNISDSQFPWAPSKHVWNNQYKVLLRNVFRSESFQSALNQFSKKLYNMDQTGVDSATEDLSKIIVSATESIIPRKPHMRKKTKYNRKWFDKSCSQLRSELNRLSVQCSRKPMKYKKLLKHKEKEYLNKLKKQLKNLEHKNLKQSWAIIKNLQGENTLKSKNPIDYDIWLNYFRKLYAVDSADQDTKTVDDVPTNSESFHDHKRMPLV